MNGITRSIVAAGIVAFAMVFSTVGAYPAFAADCSGFEHSIGACVGNGSVDIGGSIERPGSGGSGSEPGGAGWTPHPDWQTGGDGTPGSNIGPGGETVVCSTMRPDECWTFLPPPAEAADALDAAVQPVTIRDIASFAPDAPTVTTEPGAWGILKLHTNVVANAAQHVRSGTLLGGPAEVNFIPIGFTIDYGDGQATTTATGGDTWAALGLAEFSKTATSHRYTKPGTKTITAEVTYAAEYRVGGGAWLPVVGTLSIPTDTPHTIQIVRNSTVGVDKPCTPGRTAVGC
ncbi:MAG TPA: hypothetical protein VNJ54_16395 [Plantibacter sp.]|uniref:hypothetical protein n=1 Tax=Plantibacter sp. TaxID=1871045 RepID=UPI002BA4091B|nr:hypothetical protein [Plantibacter sp.]